LEGEGLPAQLALLPPHCEQGDAHAGGKDATNPGSNLPATPGPLQQQQQQKQQQAVVIECTSKGRKKSIKTAAALMDMQGGAPLGKRTAALACCLVLELGLVKQCSPQPMQVLGLVKQCSPQPPDAVMLLVHAAPGVFSCDD
jgi:hypothetical protein